MDKKAPKVFHLKNNKTNLNFKKKEKKKRKKEVKKQQQQKQKQQPHTLSIVIVVDRLYIAYSLCCFYIAFTCTALANYVHT